MEISCIVIDDEPLAIAKLEKFISRVPGLRHLRSFDNPLEVLPWLKENKTDLVFLDIQMEALSGIHLLETTSIGGRIIITSAFDEYAIKGFELNVADYLLKPFSFERFLKAVDKVMDYYSSKNKESQHDTDERRFIFVKTEYRHERIDIDEIQYIEGMKDYLRIVCTGKKIMTLQNFASIEKSLPRGKFCRVHKSYMVAIDKIRSVERGIVLVGDIRIPVSLTYRERFYAMTGLKLH
ncbi:MAG: LytTR family DNA-binding domain-containing protein [Bacteroidales bacterium]